MVVIERSEIKINLVDEINDKVDDEAKKQIRKDQHIWFPLLLLLS